LQAQLLLTLSAVDDFALASEIILSARAFLETISPRQGAFYVTRRRAAQDIFASTWAAPCKVLFPRVIPLTGMACPKSQNQKTAIAKLYLPSGGERELPKGGIILAKASLQDESNK
jgi:hypothetical protein